MKSKPIMMMLIVTLIAFGSGVLAGTGLTSKQARRFISTMGGIALSPDDVHVRSIDVGLGGKDAVVEALVQTGFKLTRENGQWSVTHVRTGDRQWESVELVTTAVTAEKVKRTQADLREVAQSLDAYKRDHESYPQVPNFAALIDALMPRYLHRVVREDFWHQSYVYNPTAHGYRILSPGADGQPGTGDDIIIQNGEWIMQTSG